MRAGGRTSAPGSRQYLMPLQLAGRRPLPNMLTPWPTRAPSSYLQACPTALALHSAGAELYHNQQIFAV